MSIGSELTIREHCEKVEVAREIATESNQKASNQSTEQLVEQQPYLQSPQATNEELLLRVFEAIQLTQELLERKKLMAEMLNNKLASYPSLMEALGIDSNEQPIDNSGDNS